MIEFEGIKMPYQTVCLPSLLLKDNLLKQDNIIHDECPYTRCACDLQDVILAMLNSYLGSEMQYCCNEFLQL